jgi:uncharacterized oligopeptide transporter (OPT) family protein
MPDIAPEAIVCAVVNWTRETEMESAVTNSAATQPGRDTPRRGIVLTIAISLIASSAVLGLLVAGVTFLALAIAFEVAVPIAQQYHVSVSAADMAVAGRLAEFWWVFTAVSVGSFVAAAVVAVKAVSHLDPAPLD